jgi:hypothetical protein
MSDYYVHGARCEPYKNEISVSLKWYTGDDEVAGQKTYKDTGRFCRAYP